MWVQEMELPRLQQMSAFKSLAPEPSCWLICGLNYVFRGGLCTTSCIRRIVSRVQIEII
jgi:hypothetical protein